jgi:hypothetical protein
MYSDAVVPEIVELEAAGGGGAEDVGRSLSPTEEGARSTSFARAVFFVLVSKSKMRSRIRSCCSAVNSRETERGRVQRVSRVGDMK